MRSAILITLAFLAGCDSPSLSLRGGSVHQVDVQGSRFRVYRQAGGTLVEAHRVSFEALPSLVQTLEKAFLAIEMATGCIVMPGSLRGDQAIILAEVECVPP
ncbi:MAG: hypothetical protein V3U96_11115 [Paracoccaceae bacterium]